MKAHFNGGEWRYARLVLVLLVLAGVSSMLVLRHFEGHLGANGTETALSQLALTFLALTTGLLFLAGAFGIWAIRTTTAIEGRRRIGQLVDDMAYLNDGVLVVDPSGRVHGMNASATALSSASADVTASPALRDLFPCLSDDDEKTLLHPSHTRELERVARRGAALYSLRFRSQPSSDMNMILVSDVTAARTRQMREVQISHFQLIGRIARGVAHDFNDILCAISAHANLLVQTGRDPEADRESLETIAQEARRGSDLARQLIGLGRMDAEGQPTDRVAEHIEQAADLLRVVLPGLWEVGTDVAASLPAISLAGNQLEQILLNLGLLAAEEFTAPGEVRIRATPSRWDRVGPREVVIDVSATPPGVRPADVDAGNPVPVEDAGVVESVIQSVLEEAGGAIEICSSHQGHHRYRIVLPELNSVHKQQTAEAGMSPEIIHALRSGKVLLAHMRDFGGLDLEERLRALDISVEYATDLVVVLGRMETTFPFDAMVIDRRLLGDTADALLKAMLKLKPDVAMVVLCEEPELEARDLQEAIVFESLDATPDTILHALARAKKLAGAREDVSG